MTFKNLEIKDKNEISELLSCDSKISTERNFATMFIWSKVNNTQFCISNNMVFFYFEKSNVSLYTMPLGFGNISAAIKEIKLDAQKRNRPYKIISITENYLKYFENYSLTPQRDYFDYIYDSNSFITLAGKKLHSKRNFINRFKKEYEGRWNYKNLDFIKDREPVFEFLNKWSEESSEDKLSLQDETLAIETAFDYYKELEITGGILTVDNQIVAFCLASPQNEIAIDVMFEKADYNYSGAYQVIANEFSKQNCSSYQYINREEDMGIEGLRKAKLSYCPAFLSEKYETDCN